MIKVPCKVTLTGDKRYASYFIGAAQSQMRILENQMSFQNLKQGTRKTRLDPKTISEAIVCFNLSEVKIYSEPEIIKMGEEEGLDRLYPRFFAYVVKVDDITGINSREYYWLYFNKKGNNLDEFEQTKDKTPTELSKDYEVYAWKIPGSIRDQMIFKCSEKLKENKVELLEKMREVPYYSLSVFTKSFTIYAAADEEKKNGRRFAAAAHLMTSNYENIFEPIHWPSCIGNINSKLLPDYSRPTNCFPDDPYRVGLFLVCPPNRFYCNTEKRIMVWYTAKSRNPEIAGGDYICGVILNLDTKNIRFFLVYSEEASGHELTPYWTVDEKHEVPCSMITEVEELTDEELTITIQWGGRPIRIRESLKIPTVEYEEIESVDHRVWTGTGTGFDKIPSIKFNQEFTGPPEDHLVEVSQELYDCHQNDGSIEGCEANNNHMREIEGFEYFGSTSNDYTKHSSYDIAFYGKHYKIVADKKFLEESDQIYTKIQYCVHQFFEILECYSRFFELNKGRGVVSDFDTKKANGVYASWINPNTAFILRERDIDYISGAAEYNGYEYGGDTWEDWQERCPLAAYEDYPITFTCFYGFKNVLLELWNRLENENYNTVGPTRRLERSGTDDIDNETEINEYIIDEKITLEGIKVDRSYYLDDRATDNNQGVLVAAKSNSDEKLYGTDALTAVYKPESWEINWKMAWNEDDRSLQGCITPDDEIDYIDIKDKLLEALNCKVDELIDLGLV